MTTTIITKNSSTAGAAPLAADLVQGELAVNVTSKALYTKNASAAVVKLNTPSIVDNGDATAITIDSSENVGIGTATAPAKLTVGALGVFRVQTGSTTMDCTPTPGATDGFVWNTSASSYYDWAISGSSKIRIDSSGNLLVGTTSVIGAGKISIQFEQVASRGISLQNTNSTNTGTYLSFYNSSGTQQGYITQTNSSTTQYATSSDYRLKNNPQPMTGALSVVQQLKPCTYTWKVDGSNGQGFIAHELQAVVPDCVTGEKDAVDADGKPVYQGIDTSFLVATLTAAIQELNAKFEEYKAAHP